MLGRTVYGIGGQAPATRAGGKSNPLPSLPPTGSPRRTGRLPAILALAGWLLSPLSGADRTVLLVGKMLDGRGGIQRNTRIVVEEGRIREIDPEATGDRVYDLRPFTVMPGWIDTHVHIGTHFEPNGRFHGLTSQIDESDVTYALYVAHNLFSTLQGGFTTVQSVGALPHRARIDRALRDWVAQGNPGPRLLVAIGMVTESVGNPEAIRQFIRNSVEADADVIKIFATKSIRDGGERTLSDAQMEAACGEARRLGTRSVVHAQSTGGARAAVRAGCTSVEHGNILTREVLDEMRQARIYYDPNFFLLHYYLDNKPKFLGIDNYTEEGFEFMKKGISNARETFQKALASGVKIVFGTDALAGIHGHNSEEFIYRVRDGGQKPLDAMTSAQSLAAESLGLADEIGSLEVGYQADIVALQGDPLLDIEAVRQVAFVMKGGVVYRNEPRQ